VYFAIDFGEAYFHAYQFEDSMRSDAQFASTLTDDKIRGHLAALAASAAAAGRVELLKVDGGSVHDSGLVPALREAGFKSTPRGMAVLA